MIPSFRYQSSLHGRMTDKSFAVPMILLGNLRQKQSPCETGIDHQAVPPDLNVLDLVDFLQGRQY